MKQVKLFLYNYGTITQIADFKNAGHDAHICLRAMNDNQIAAHGRLGTDIFYFLEWKGKHNKHITVEFTGNKHIAGQDAFAHEQKIKQTLFVNNNLQFA